MSERGRGVFVTGTDTGVGKTVVSAALLLQLRRHGPVRFWKPIQTGIEQDNDTETVQRLSDCAPRELLNAGIRLPRPLSPHLAAAAASAVIDLDDLVTLQSAQPPDERWIVEGAGGALVPINDRELMIDLMARLGLPVVVAARTRLGTINHTLLTLEALRHRGLDVAGVVMVGEGNAQNRDSIARYGDVEIIGELPMLPVLSAATLSSASAGWCIDRLVRPPSTVAS